MGAQQKKLLYLVHRIPYPPNKGDKIRSFNILKYLSQHFQVYLGTFIDDDHDWRYLKDLETYCQDFYAAPLKPLQAKLRSLPALLSGSPMTIPYYNDAGLRAWIGTQKDQHDFDAVLVFSSAMAQYVMGHKWAHQHRVIDFVDVDSDKWLQYAATKSWPMNWVYRREANTLLTYDKRVADEFEASLFVSAKEAELFAAMPGVDEAKVGHADNGVDIEYFNPDADYPNPYGEAEQVIVFTGAMDYWANADAVAWFAREVLPEIRQQHPAAQFYIVGSRPSRQVQELASLPGVKVTGSVKEILPYLAHARLVVAPMRIARGVQNKVLEAMAMAKAVVVTPQGFDGITAEANNEVMVAESTQAFAAAVTDLLDQPDKAAQLGQVARRHIEHAYSWDNSLQVLLPKLEGSK
ncbi:MAG TPA: TIGR03087 family PEP-CTERM/XrtA system glycosyltransferase [Candidatus Tenderia electrophaga]|uniref:TIGR03087 family PEP-CTERM/XrtA system glycosyltransferase n=1 Tax=Candidatus Tenderia electrophaga TaxID=1748243 RepID=A0A832J9W0_9GAMM|nr:TIGR03087 family PEP-CTERM/XrtA system glycosyltransferase [Candidatus Tenderia electrophaga]